ncbi:hypothetical protein [Pseudooceanicola spongiae]|uniref:Uncharacterized protein n=1 Tax=Pseudooceanicola spongiae TaxID=2613965 RepID=A0A7L9WR89_9RHOB|nr:hypothetical protein [Pseudooceanicola spongiae]QOL82799.1 hypothetical protein F3W81_19390 [Pseudooceanicola spongiae]
MRNVRPASIQSAVQSSMRAGGGLEAVANDLGVGVSTLSHGTELSEQRPGGLGVNYLDRLGRISPKAAVPIAQHFAALGGGVFHPLEVEGRLASDIHQITRDFSDVLQRHGEAHSPSSENPNDYTPKEAMAQVVELDQMVCAAMNFRAALLQKAGVSVVPAQTRAQ